jgi:hypothetical protein
VAQRPAERVARADPVDDRHGDRRHLGTTSCSAIRREHSLGALFDDGEADADVVQRRGRRPRFTLGDRGVALVEIAHRDGRVGQRLLYPVPCFLP